jgi:hypothetical protein
MIMIAKVLSLTVCMSLFGANLCMAQSNTTIGNPDLSRLMPYKGDQPKVPVHATNWGPSVRGVRLLIYMTNSVVESGSTANVLTVITNGSTNSIGLGFTALPSDFGVLLTGSGGRLYHLTAPPLALRINQRMTIMPGEQDARNIQVTFGEPIHAWEDGLRKNIEPGDYTLQATRNFEGGKVESNLITVRVK